MSFELTTTVIGATIYVPTDYPTIQDAIDNASDGYTVYVYNGTYYENILVTKTINLIGEDSDITIINGGSNGSVITIHNVQWVSISGFSIIASGSAGAYAGIMFDNAQHCRVNENNISGNKKGIWFGNLSLHNTIDGNIVSNNSRGFHIQSDKNSIINNLVVSNRGEGIWMIGTSQISIKYNNISDNMYGVVIYDSVNINVSNNDFTNDGIFIRGHILSHYNSHDIPTNNIVNGNPLYYFKDSNGLNINGSKVGQLILSNCNNSNIKNLKITNTDIGIEIARSTNTTLLGNEISNNYQKGVYLESSLNTNIIGNKILNNTFGIQLEISSFTFPCSHNNIKGNDVLNNSWGIYLGGSSNNNINNNNISANKLCGIKLWWSEYNNITNNIISLNRDGIDAKSVKSINNSIFHNNFVFNINQSFDGTNNQNRWDNGYPSGGNYWSNYGGVDNFKGPNQNIPGSDGIGDTNYTIDIDSIDHYPLMVPYKPLENYIVLKQGWNLISIPLIQEEKNITRVLGSIDGYYDAVQWYDNTDPIDPWKHYKVGKPYGNDLFDINETIGFWIHIIPPGETTFYFKGVRPLVNQSITLHTGWNMVGYPSLSNKNRTNALNNLTFDTHVDSIWTFDARYQSWLKIKENDYFEMGRGYWIHTRYDCVWEVLL